MLELFIVSDTQSELQHVNVFLIKFVTVKGISERQNEIQMGNWLPWQQTQAVRQRQGIISHPTR